MNDPASLLRVTVNSVCRANPQAATLGGTSGKTQIQWQATGTESYDLHLPGGVFVGQTDPFTLTITGTGWQPDTPYQLVSNATAATYSKYVYQNGQNCQSLSGDLPPDIIIES